MISDSDCNICFEPCSKNDLIECPFCSDKNGATCKDCLKMYLLSTTQEPHCSGCKKVWTNKFLYSVFVKSWLEKDHRAHLKTQSLVREKYFLSDTMAKIPNLKETIKKERTLMDLLDRERELKSELNVIQKLITDCKTVDGIRYHSRTERALQLKGDDAPKKVSTFVCPCPNPDPKGCRGMIKSEDYICSSCDVEICKRCRVITNPEKEHRCKKSDLKTVKFLKKDTKACPKCAIAIHKISGCDQIWCVECHTAFSWKTGEIETGTIHNPHYYQYLKNNNIDRRNIGDIPCGGLINFELLVRALGKHKTSQIQTIHRRIGEIEMIVRHLRNRTDEDFEDLRVDYAIEWIDEKEWAKKIFIRERANKRFKTMIEILLTFQLLMIERFRELASGGSIEKFMEEAEGIRNYINETMNEEMSIIGCKNPPQIAKSTEDMVDTWKDEYRVTWLWDGSYVKNYNNYYGGNYGRWNY